jgi:hypothetical protein
MKKLFSLIILAIVSFSATAQETVTISPTWGQSFKWANNTLWVIIGVVLIAAAIALFVKFKDNGLRGVLAGGGLLIALGLTSILLKPIGVKWNNDKKIDAVHLQNVGEQHIWDSLKNNCLIVDGPHNCYK